MASNNHRNFLAKIYNKNLTSKLKRIFKEKKWEKLNYFRYPILCKTKEENKKLVIFMRKNNIILWTTWLGTNIVPIWTDTKKTKYKKGSCKISEDISSKILFLPNHKLATRYDVEKIVKLINNFYRKNV